MKGHVIAYDVTYQPQRRAVDEAIIFTSTVYYYFDIFYSRIIDSHFNKRALWTFRGKRAGAQAPIDPPPAPLHMPGEV